MKHITNVGLKYCKILKNECLPPPPPTQIPTIQSRAKLTLFVEPSDTAVTRLLH